MSTSESLASGTAFLNYSSLMSYYRNDVCKILFITRLVNAYGLAAMYVFPGCV